MELSTSPCSTPGPGQSCWFNLVCPATDHRTMLHVHCQGFLRRHPVLGARVTLWIACQRALGHHRKLHTRWTMHTPLPTVRIWTTEGPEPGEKEVQLSRQLKCATQGRPSIWSSKCQIISPLGASTPWVPSREPRARERQQKCGDKPHLGKPPKERRNLPLEKKLNKRQAICPRIQSKCSIPPKPAGWENDQHM